jgi:DNA mismatch repair protein MutS
LTALAAQLSEVRNYNVAVREWQDQVVFLHKILPGAADKSYGIHVARLAGVPSGVIERAKQILAQLENQNLDGQGQPKLVRRGKTKRSGDLQLTLFAPDEHPLIGELRQLDLNAMTPIAALQLLERWQSAVGPETKK